MANTLGLTAVSVVYRGSSILKNVNDVSIRYLDNSGIVIGKPSVFRDLLIQSYDSIFLFLSNE